MKNYTWSYFFEPLRKISYMYVNLHSYSNIEDYFKPGDEHFTFSITDCIRVELFFRENINV